MTSDPALLDAYREECNTYGPGVAWVMWEGRPGIDPDDLLKVAAKVDLNGPSAPPYCHHPSPPPYRVAYPPTPDDGLCRRCRGGGCAACDARFNATPTTSS